MHVAEQVADAPPTQERDGQSRACGPVRPESGHIAPLVAEMVVREMEGRDHGERHRDGQRQGDRSSTIDREPAREAATLRGCGGSGRWP